MKLAEPLVLIAILIVLFGFRRAFQKR